VEGTWQLAEIDGFVSNPCSSGRFLDGVDPALTNLVRRSLEHGADGVTVLDNSCRSPQMMGDWFINIACSGRCRQGRLNQFVPEIAILVQPTNSIGHE
jgi:hypothetical protein